MACRIVFFEVGRGTSPPQDFLAGLPPKALAKMLRTIGLLETHGSALGEPYMKRLTGWPGLLELRTSVGSDAFRLFLFFAESDLAVIVHGIRKKTERTPIRELRTAESRRQEYLRRV